MKRSQLGSIWFALARTITFLLYSVTATSVSLLMSNNAVKKIEYKLHVCMLIAHISGRVCYIDTHIRGNSALESSVLQNNNDQTVMQRKAIVQGQMKGHVLNSWFVGQKITRKQPF